MTGDRVVLVAAMRVEERPLRRRSRGIPGVTVQRSGIGRTVPVEADVVIASGLAGGLTADLRPGDVVIPDAVSDGTAGPTACDPALLQRLRAAAVSLGVTPHGGMLVTADHIVRGGERVLWASRGFDAVDMESATWAARAPRFATVRVILDTPTHELSAAWARPSRAIAQPWLWAEAARLVRDGPKFSDVAARIVGHALRT